MTNQDVWKTKYRLFEARSISDEMPPIYNVQIKKAKASAPVERKWFQTQARGQKTHLSAGMVRVFKLSLLILSLNII